MKYDRKILPFLTPVCVFRYSSDICYHHLQEENCHTIKTVSALRSLPNTETSTKQQRWKIMLMLFFQFFFPILYMEKKSRVRSVFFMHMHELRCKIYPTKKETEFLFLCRIFFIKKKVIIFFALLFLNCRLWMKNNRINYNLASGPFKGERCFRKTETRRHQVLSALIMTSLLLETPLCFR